MKNSDSNDYPQEPVMGWPVTVVMNKVQVGGRIRKALNKKSQPLKHEVLKVKKSKNQFASAKLQVPGKVG